MAVAQTREKVRSLISSDGQPEEGWISLKRLVTDRQDAEDQG